MTKEEFKLLFDQYFDPIRNYLYYRCGNTELATDIAQETFMKLWEKKIDFDLNLNKGLLYKIAGDLLSTYFRRKNIEENYIDSLELSIVTESPIDHVQHEELKASYQISLAKLSEKQRTVFLLSRMDGLSYKEIALRLELSVKAVEKRMSIALVELRKHLKHHVRK